MCAQGALRARGLLLHFGGDLRAGGAQDLLRVLRQLPLHRRAAALQRLPHRHAVRTAAAAAGAEGELRLCSARTQPRQAWPGSKPLLLRLQAISTRGYFRHPRRRVKRGNWASAAPLTAASGAVPAQSESGKAALYSTTRPAAGPVARQSWAAVAATDAVLGWKPALCGQAGSLLKHCLHSALCCTCLQAGW